MPGAADNSEYQDRNAAFLQALAEKGWAVGRNTRFDYRWGAGQVERYRAYAEELVALAPDVILGNGTAGQPAALGSEAGKPARAKGKLKCMSR